MASQVVDVTLNNLGFIWHKKIPIRANDREKKNSRSRLNLAHIILMTVSKTMLVQVSNVTRQTKIEMSLTPSKRGSHYDCYVK